MQRDQAHRTNELLERIAKALEKDVKYKVKNNQLVPDIPGFEGTLDQLDDLCNIRKNNPHLGTGCSLDPDNLVNETSNITKDVLGNGNGKLYDQDVLDAYPATWD